MWWRTWSLCCSCNLCPAWGGRDTALCSSVIARWWLALPQHWHTYNHAHTLTCARTESARWGQRGGRRLRRDAVDHRPVKSLHPKLTRMAMVCKVCGRGGGVGGDGLGIVINLCLVWNKEISSHTNRQRLFVTPLWDSGDRRVCTWLMAIFCLKNSK